MEIDLHSLITKISHVLEILTNFHVLALFIINTTKTPYRALSSPEGYSFIGRFYRLVELLAGLVTPLAKK
ncbi:MAG: hypothetical protein ACO3I1_05225 [Burkholderiales bacterium]